MRNDDDELAVELVLCIDGCLVMLLLVLAAVGLVGVVGVLRALGPTGRW